MAIEYMTWGNSGGCTADDTPAFTVPDALNLCMLIFLTDRDSNAHSNGPIWQSDTFTVISHFAQTPAIEAWYLVDPTVAGPADITLAPNGYNNAARGAMYVVFSGVDQDDPIKDWETGDSITTAMTAGSEDCGVIVAAESDHVNQWEGYSRGSGQTIIAANWHTRVCASTGTSSLQNDLSYEIGEGALSATVGGLTNNFGVVLRAAPTDAPARRSAMMFSISLAGLALPAAMGKILSPTMEQVMAYGT